MNAERLLQHYEQITEAPDAIARLRRFILDLAMRGKLVPQDPADEPASELLKQIAAEKARLVKAGEIRKPKVLEPVDRPPFELPHSWNWVRIRQVTSDRGQEVPTDAFTYIDVGAINKEVGVVGEPSILDASEAPSRARKVVRRGDVIYSCVRPYLLNIAVIDTDFVPKPIASTAFAVLNGHGYVVPRYIWTVLRSPFMVECVEETQRGLAYPAINDADFAVLPFPLPPLAEQHRIVAKVDELMALCDELEAARTERETKRDRLAAASLARLNAPDLETFRDDARFALDALPALTARPDQIKQLRQTILNLAVRGKLVPQDPTDEPAEELLKRIFAEKKRLMAEKGIRGQKPALPAENFEMDTDIPETWQHVYLQDIAYQITDGTHLTPKYTETGKPFLSAQNVKPFRFMPEKHRFVSEQDFDSYRANRRPERGDILLTRVGAGIGEAAVLDSDFEFAFYVSLCLIKVPTCCINVEYLVLWLNSPEGRDSSSSRTYGKGASQGNLNLGLIRTFKIPLPPLAEQHRIVAKFDELMALCDQLEVSLTSADETRKKLLDALLAEALAPVDAIALQEAAE